MLYVYSIDISGETTPIGCWVLVCCQRAWAAQQRGVGQEHVKPTIVGSINDEILELKTPAVRYSRV